MENKPTLTPSFGTILVIRYGIAAIYPNFSTSIMDDEKFGKDGAWVTGGASDRLILQIQRNNYGQ